MLQVSFDWKNCFPWAFADAPSGAPGWNAFVAPILHTIKPSLIPKWRDTVAHESDEVIDISRDKVIVAAADLQIALDRLSLLLDATPSASLCRRLVDPIMVQLWAITSWLGAQVPLKDKYCDVAAVILQTFLKISSATEKAEVLINNLLYVGEVENDSVAWKYHLSGVDVLEVVVPRRLEPPPHIQDLEWVEVEQKSACLASTLVESCTDSEISTLFLQLFRKWVTAKSGPAEAVKTKDEDVEMKDPTRGLLELVVLQQLMEKAPQKLISKADQLLELVSEILDADARESQGSEILSVTLSILNHVISAPVFQKSDLKPGVLELIEGSLERISREGETEGVAQTARNLLLLLKYRGELDETGGATPATDKQVEDRNTYRLAIQYITDTESPPPVKSEGLNLISGLIKANSPAVDLPAVLLLLSRLLAESEDFINLRVIKMFVQLANKHPKTVCQEILDHYLDPKEMSDTDTRLRFGEALLQTIERLGETFTGEVAKQVFEVLLSIASRRGYRPKTEKRQEREARKREKENKEAAEAWGGEVPDMSDDVPEEERLNNEILSRIVEGWESKRGSEDIRMRASALSILSSVIETNIADFGPSLVSAGVDLCLFVLAFEPEPEKAILRRAAIFYILGFVRALAKAREERKNLGFGLTDESRGDILRTLRYIMGTDNDGMVQEHARDVIESLENLRIGDLLQQNQNRGPDIRDITGLGERLNIPGSVSAPRPRIEEIE